MVVALRKEADRTPASLAATTASAATAATAATAAAATEVRRVAAGADRGAELIDAVDELPRGGVQDEQHGGRGARRSRCLTP